MIEVQVSELVVGKIYYIERIHPYPNQCNKFRGRHIGNNTEYPITSSFNEVLSVTPSLAHTHNWPTLNILQHEFRYYQFSQDKAQEDREKRIDDAILNYYLQLITRDPSFHLIKTPYTHLTLLPTCQTRNKNYDD